MNQILKTFNYDELLIKEYKNWYLLLRSHQATIGSMVLIEKNFHTKFSDIPNESFIEFGKIVKEIEATLSVLFSYDKINYLMLMMKDKEVHFHVIPRKKQDNIKLEVWRNKSLNAKNFAEMNSDIRKTVTKLKNQN